MANGERVEGQMAQRSLFTRSEVRKELQKPAMDITSGYIKVRSWRTWIFFYPGLCTLYKITLLKQAIITNSALDWLWVGGQKRSWTYRMTLGLFRALRLRVWYGNSYLFGHIKPISQTSRLPKVPCRILATVQFAYRALCSLTVPSWIEF